MSAVPRRPRFKASYVDQAAKLAALGATDQDMADFFMITPDVFSEWTARHRRFREAIEQNKNIADDQVERSLYERAIGYSHPEDKVFANGGKPVVVPTVKYYPPDPTSILFWLKNRRPDRWRDKVDHELAGEGGQSIKVEFVKPDDPRDDP
ncbi:MAG: hypothetical protein AAGF59_15050 [Pseudomonadota bacterium]